MRGGCRRGEKEKERGREGGREGGTLFLASLKHLCSNEIAIMSRFG